ncbi:MAG: potassium channel family protein, partial [Candidatus Sericytochromatia bacterium]
SKSFRLVLLTKNSMNIICRILLFFSFVISIWIVEFHPNPEAFLNSRESVWLLIFPVIALVLLIGSTIIRTQEAFYWIVKTDEEPEFSIPSVIDSLFYNDSSNVNYSQRSGKEKFVYSWIGYLKFILAFAYIYYFVSWICPTAFNKNLNCIDSLYFSVISSLTIGYGDICPTSSWTKILVMVQVLFGFFYGTLILSSVIKFLHNKKS